MIEQLAGLADNILRVRVSAKLGDEDFTKLSSLVDAAVAGQGKIRLLIEFHDFHGWDVHGLRDDLKFHTTQSTGIERIAYVGDRAWEKWMVSVAKAFPGPIVRYFDASEIDVARAWLEER
jgi:hypothetical protein